MATPPTSPLSENAPLSPYGSYKLLTEVILRGVRSRTALRHSVLRCSNVAGGDPTMRQGQSPAKATHLIKVAVHTALGLHPYMEVDGTD
jgi:UDP-glucose 4-epimerase